MHRPRLAQIPRCHPAQALLPMQRNPRFPMLRISFAKWSTTSFTIMTRMATGATGSSGIRAKRRNCRKRSRLRRGPVARLELSNGRPISADAREDEDRRLQHLLTSPSEQAQHRKEYSDDEHRIGRILALLPDAFLYEPAEEEAKSQQMPECACYHMRFRPNPDYPAHSIESRIFHAMTGDLWISADHKRLVRLDGKLQDNVDFGYGILGRLYKGGWFRLERTHVNAGASASGNGDWKTQRLEVHMIGRAMLFKTIARETSEVRGGFAPVPSGMSLQQAAAVLGREPMTAVGARNRPPWSLRADRAGGTRVIALLVGSVWAESIGRKRYRLGERLLRGSITTCGQT